MEAPNDMKERLRASYNGMAGEYNTWTERHHHFRQKYLDELFKRSPDLASPDGGKKVVLELGCGAGTPFLDNLLAHAPAVHAHANDMSDTQIDLARTNLAAYKDRVEFHAGDMTKLDFAPGSLSAVVGLYSIIHLPQEEQSAMIKSIGKWLKPGGIFIATFGLEETKGVVFDKWIHEKGWMFWSALGKEATVEAVKAAGLEIESAEAEGDSAETFLWIIAKKTGE